jgi:hypothetical protein
LRQHTRSGVLNENGVTTRHGRCNDSHVSSTLSLEAIKPNTERPTRPRWQDRAPRRYQAGKAGTQTATGEEMSGITVIVLPTWFLFVIMAIAVANIAIDVNKILLLRKKARSDKAKGTP